MTIFRQAVNVPTVASSVANLAKTLRSFRPRGK